MPSRKKDDPTAPKDSDPVCDSCNTARAVLIHHDDDGTPHPRCERCDALLQAGLEA